MNRMLPLFLLAGATLCAADLYVSPSGNDSGHGTSKEPLRTLAAAQRLARSAGAKVIHVRPGVYYLPETLVFTAADSGSAAAPVTYAAEPGGAVVLSGGARLNLKWTPYRNGILQAKVPAGFQTDQLFVDGVRQHMARYPNYDAQSQYFQGWAADAFSRERAARWADPRGGFMHAMHRYLWGDFHYEITGKSASGELTYEGGWQNNRPLGMHDKYRYVENVFEELDAPGEWFLNRNTSMLYFYPPAGFDARKALIEAVVLRHLIEFRGTQASPVRFVKLDGFTFRHAARTFMENREPLLRSDWTTYRGGAVFLTGTEDVSIENSTFDQLGGNAIFVSNYSRRVAIRGCHIQRAGANGIAFVGDPAAVRSPLFFTAGKEKQSISEIDRTPGPLTANYPADSIVEDCLIHETGRVEKQTAPIQISMSESITVRHCSIYDVPRAGINISEGTWGGHIIEYCDVFDTVKETGDHGSFNSWGRDRFWGLEGVDLNALTTPEERALPFLDAGKTTTIRNNRWRCDHGWDIDLDDGSSNYEIVNNLCLRGGLKLREGFGRRVENNIIVGNSFHPHVWYRGSGDLFRRNIVGRLYRPIRVPVPWGADIDWNVLHQPGVSGATPASGLSQQSGRDQHSIAADVRFVNPAQGDYRVREGSPALAQGFRNFAMDQFGVRKAGLRAMARTPVLPKVSDAPAETIHSARDVTPWQWLGATLRNVAGLGEVSAAGLPGEVGVLVVTALPESAAYAAGLRSGDVIVSAGGEVKSINEFRALWNRTAAGVPLELTVIRQQKQTRIRVAKR
ncbi:MAG TPA: PDZ domain-containing protein [Paludibaculum sp.]